MKKYPSQKIKEEEQLLLELSALIENCQQQVIVQVNSALTLLFWHMGNRINRFILQHKRAAYGRQIVVTLSRQLTEKYGRNFEEKNLRRMLQLAAQFSDYDKVVTLSRHLSWSHFLTLLPLKTLEAKVFYAGQIIHEQWSVRELRRKIEQKTYERSRIADARLHPVHQKELAGNFKDPYFLDFLNLPDSYLENDLEEAILKELEKFILEIGKGFAFVERQKRMIIDGEDYYLDLLFYHRRLKRLVAIDLKIGKFQARDKGQMELYLKWLDKYEKQEGEQSPIGLILCAEASREQIELLEMHKGQILVAEYWTELPPKKELEKRLHRALLQAKENIERKKLSK